MPRGWGLALLAYCLAALAGLSLALHIFPLSFLFPDPQQVLAGDAITHAVGQRYFFQEPWHWPPLRIHNVIRPGVPLGFLDAIPLEAAILKLLVPGLPPGFHGIHLWYAIVWVLQPVAAVFCIRSAGERRLLPALAFAALCLCLPAWWARVGHAALTGHFTLLLALGLYFRLLGPRPWAAWAGAVALILAAVLIHPYLAAMTAALILAAPATLLWRAALARLPGPSRLAPGAGPPPRDRSLLPVLQALGGGALAVAAMVLLARGLGYGGAAIIGGYGVFNLNVLSPVWPFWSGLLPNPPDLAHAPGSTGWEGYNWLGLGLLASLALGIAFRAGEAARGAWRHAGLTAVLLALTIIAVSTRVGFGGRLLIDLGEAPQILSQFRASGRLFWPVAYGLALSGILLVARLRPAILGNGLLVLLPLTQWLDAAPLRAHTMASARSEVPVTPEARALRSILPSLTEVTVLPSWHCWVPEATPVADPVLMQLLGVASERALPVNTAYLARQVEANWCAHDKSRGASPMRAGEVRIYLTPGEDDWLRVRPAGPHRCEKVEHALFCRRPEEPLPAAPGNLVSDGLSFLASGNAFSAMSEGWRTPGESWTWSGGDEATLILQRDAGTSGPLRLTFEALGFAPPGRTTQHVTVTVNGRETTSWELPHMAFARPVLEVPPGSEALRIDFRFGRPSSPAETGMSVDSRILAMGLRSMRVEPR